ncbi:MAG: transglutaminase-like domain-containing protein [Nanoarchaeota archaeon]|nr:transglutaminase-like domain-containing protein [Nanoarchaeota archaeon]
MIKQFILVIMLVSMFSFSVYAQIDNPYTIDYLKVDIIQTGEIDTTGRVEDMELTLSIPQNDQYQKVENIESNVNYTEYYDDIGNKYLKLKWIKPEVVNKFRVKTTVTINRRNTMDVEKFPEFIDSTQLVDYDTNDIDVLSKTFRGNDIDKIFSVATWVNKNIKYDMEYAQVNMSASWVLENRKGVCDEITTLFVALTRSMGYYSPYIAGYAYSKDANSMDGFVAHGWAEVNGIPVDVTWSQGGFLDATHIKFAKLADSSYTQASLNARGLGSFKVDLKDITTEITTVENTESLIIGSTSSLLDDIVYKGYVVVKSDVTSDRCVLTKLKVQGCIDSSGENVMRNTENNDAFYFCNQRKVFSILELLDEGNALGLYKCPIVVLPYGGETETVSVKVSFENEKKVDLSTDKTNLAAGEEYSVYAKDSYIFTSNGDFAYQKSQFIAPHNDFILYGYNSGTLVSENMHVTDTNSILIETEVSQPDIEIIVEKPEDVSIGFFSMIFNMFSNLFKGLSI